MKFSRMVFIFLSLVLLSFSACKDDFLKDVTVEVPVAPRPSMMDYLKYNYSFSMLYDALLRTGLAETLKDTSKPFTIMAPDNAAFAASGITSDSLGKMDVAYLKELLSYHILPGKLPETSIPVALNNKFLSISNRELYISKQLQGMVTVNGVFMLSFGSSRDVEVANGIVHLLAKVLALPPANLKEMLVNNPAYSRFAAALRKFGLLDKLDGKGPFVVLAISDDYFMSEESLNELDTLTHKKFLFDAQIFEDRLFFFSDFQLRPASWGSPNSIQYYIKPEGAVVFDNAQTVVYAVPLNAGANPDYYVWGLGDQIYMNPETPGALTGNGVLIDCYSPLVYPDNARK
ncbi:MULTISPECIES: fasciclin domain-containing protein [unclassified Chitinophaga]|uniref:fasciclin domain-containing protein n=1 Tax=unclassified Chitinophaga TaxID=2619133 RepID=UPI0030102CF4